MFKYKIIKNIPETQTQFTLYETTDKKKLIEKIKELNLSPGVVRNIQKRVQQAYIKTLEEITKEKKQPVPDDVKYTVFEYSEELSPKGTYILKVEYYPIDELIRELERETGKPAHLLLSNIEEVRRVNVTQHQIILKRYDREKKKEVSAFSYSSKKSNSEKVKKLLEKLIALKARR